MVSGEQLERLSLEAKKEIGEDDANIQGSIQALKKILHENHKDIRLPPRDDGFLLRFLRARKFDVPRSAKLVSQYFRVMHKFSDMNHFLTPKAVEWVFKNQAVSVLKQRDSLGRVVIKIRQELNSPEYFDEGLAALILLVDYINKISVDTQRIGVVLLIDMHGYSFSHIRHWKPSRLINATKLINGSCPLRIKMIHFVRNPAMFSYFFSVIKPFISEKIKSRINIHGYDFNSLHELFEPAMLAEYLGGKVPNDNYADLDLISKLVADDEYYKRERSSKLLRYGYN